MAKSNEKVRQDQRNLSSTKSSCVNRITTAAGGGSLTGLLRSEKSKLQAASSAISSRHGQFGGTLVLQRGDSKRQLLNTSFNQNTKVTRKINRRSVTFKGEQTSLVQSASNYSIDAQTSQTVLHRFCTKFLEKCYGPVMKSLKNEFRRDSSRLEVGDKVIFFAIVRFFSHWRRVSVRGNKSTNNAPTTSVVSQLIFSMDVFSFNLVLQSCDSFLEHKKYGDLELTVRLYVEMMQLLFIMSSSKDETESIMALGLLDRLFYARDPTDRLNKLISSWKPATYSKQFMCDLVELCHMTFKILDLFAAGKMKNGTNARNRKSDMDKRSVDAHDRLAMMKRAASEFDVHWYFGKIVSHQLIGMYSQLLSRYHSNSIQTNHYIMAFFNRIIKHVVSEPEDRQDLNSNDNLIVINRATLEPILFNMKLLLVLNDILNDRSIAKLKEYATLRSFSASIVRHFDALSERNPMLFVESLFKQQLQNRYCESVTNLYMNEETVMMGERERLLRAREYEMEEAELPKAKRNEQLRRPQQRNPQDRTEDDGSEDEWQDEDDSPKKVETMSDSGHIVAGAPGSGKREGRKEERDKWLSKEDEAIKAAVAKAITLKAAVTTLLGSYAGLRKVNRSRKRIKERMSQLGFEEMSQSNIVESPNEDEKGMEFNTDDDDRWNDRRTFVPKTKRKFDDKNEETSPSSSKKICNNQNETELSVDAEIGVGIAKTLNGNDVGLSIGEDDASVNDLFGTPARETAKKRLRVFEEDDDEDEGSSSCGINEEQQ